VRRLPATDQRGLTLIEMLVVVALVSTTILIFAFGLQSSQRMTTDAKLRAQMQLALTSYRTALSSVTGNGFWRPPPGAAACTSGYDTGATTAFHDAQLDTRYGGDVRYWDIPWTEKGMTFKIVGIRYWQGGPAFPGASLGKNGTFRTSCTTPDQGAQELLLEVSHPTLARPLTGTVVVRKARV